MYVSDTSHNYIRSIDMVTGKVNGAVGMGATGAVHVNSPTAVNVNIPRGLTMAAGSDGVPVMVFADQGNFGMGSFCQIRAVNFTNTATTFLGQSLPGNLVNDVAGDSAVNCGSMVASPGTDLGSATATGIRLNSPDHVAFDGSSLLFTNTNDHCIMRITPTGNLVATVGQCATSGTNDGTTATARITSPGAILVDPVYPTNYFFADSQSKLRYVNNTANTIYIGGQPIPAKSGANGSVTTILTITAQATPILAATPGYINGLAAFGNQICYAAGHPNVDNGTNGPHFVQCFDRSAASTNPTLTVGPTSSSPIRAGAPLGLEVENVNASYSVNPSNYSPVSLNSPFGLTFDSSGNLYISERSNHIIRMVRKWF
jgi:hypothetical protein